MKTMASVQDTSLDVVWIRDGVVALGYRAADRCYRAVLAVEGPPEAFAAEADRVEPLVAGFAGFLNALSQASVLRPSGLQVLVRSERADLSEYAARLEQRALGLPVDLAREALTDAAWARNEGPGLDLLSRRAYLVIPAEALTGADLPAWLAKVASGPARWFNVKSRLSEAEARQALDTRCAELAQRLEHSGVSASRLYDVGLTRLFQACWTARRNGRFEQDLQIWGTSTSHGGLKCRC
jgi:hypothetical protein